MQAIKKIDIHAHVSPFPNYAPTTPWGYPMVNKEDLIGFYNELDIEYGVLLPIVSPECQYFEPMTTETCKYVADSAPDSARTGCFSRVLRDFSGKPTIRNRLTIGDLSELTPNSFLKSGSIQ